MSAYRYFWHQKALDVTTLRDGDVARWLHAMDDDDLREVQVVPLDAVVIDGPLPSVEKHGTQGLDYRVEFPTGWGGIYSDESTPEGAETNARAWLAIAAYLREHPPVDEAQVEALTRILHEPYPDSPTWEQNQATARRLVRRGVRVEGVDQ